MPSDYATSPSSRPSMGRRPFIKITALAAGLIGLGGAALAQALSRGELQPVRKTRLLMGTLATLTLCSDNPQEAERAIGLAFARMAALEGVLSRHRQDSQLSVLNRSGQLRNPHPALQEVVRQALHFAHLTDGAFDISVGPLLALYGACARGGKLPTQQEVGRALELVDYRRIKISPGELALEPGMSLTLDGIAKGYIIDQGAQALHGMGYRRVMVEVGGDLRCANAPDGQPWRIGVLSPRDPQGGLAAVAEVAQGSLATSGDYLFTYTADRRLHHILDPRTGRSPEELSSVSVMAPNACQADALSTAIMVLGKERGMRLAQCLPAVEAMLIGKEGQRMATVGFPRAP